MEMIKITAVFDCDDSEYDDTIQGILALGGEITDET